MRHAPRKSAVAVASLTIAGLLMSGCDVKGWIDPSEVGRYERTPLQKPILTSLSSIDRSIDDPSDEFLNATDVRPEDLNVVSVDYTIGRGDLVNVSVTDLVGPGIETTKTTRVSESGNISLPLIGQVRALGLTEGQLEQSIVETYRNSQLISNAQVSVTVAEARARTFSALGAFGAPSQYAILQSDFRLLDALVLARDVVQSIDTIYIIRQVSEEPGNVKNVAPTPARNTAQPGGTGGASDLSPRAPSPAGANTPAPSTPGTTGNTNLTPNSGSSASEGFEFASPQPPSETRVIRVPLNALRNGDLRYNIVIRPRDLIFAPDPVVGEYYMGGHVGRVGVYSLTGRKITLKEAIIAAGMLDGVAIPQRTDLIRRIGPDREVFARVNLDAIFNGTAPDIYLKPYDKVMVGTNILAPFIAAVRGAFRITYGFGFLYDREYAPLQQQQQ